jgi:hypothetical protein
MKARALVWSARAVLLLPVLAGLGLLAQLPDGDRVWPYGRIHYLGVVVLAFLGDFLGFIAAGIFLYFLCWEIGLTTKTIWLTAWRQKHVRWRDRWKRVRKKPPYDALPYKWPMVDPKKPEQPLVRGRIGSR